MNGEDITSPSPLFTLLLSLASALLGLITWANTEGYLLPAGVALLCGLLGGFARGAGQALWRKAEERWKSRSK